MTIEAMDVETSTEARPLLGYGGRVALVRIVLVALIFGVWEFASGRLFSAFWVSKPSLIAIYIWKWIIAGDFFYQMSFTFGAMLAGFAMGTLLGLAAVATGETSF